MIYLDNAATTIHKPPQVPEAVLVDSSTLTIDETIDRILEICMQH